MELHSRIKKISPQLLMKLSRNYRSRPMVALPIPALLRSWKTLIKRFIDDGQTTLFRDKTSIVREIIIINFPNYNIRF